MAISMAIVKPHDIVEIEKGVSIDTLFFPEWAIKRWEETPYHVVRRGIVAQGEIAIGIRGETRGERHGTTILEQWVRSIITPESLAQEAVWQNWARHNQFPEILSSLMTLSTLFSSIRWGVGGSLGYELATGLPTLSEKSDIDIILYPEAPFSIKVASEWLWAIKSLPQRVDIQVEGSQGAFHLEEYARARDATATVLIKSATGYRLSTNVWANV